MTSQQAGETVEEDSLAYLRMKQFSLVPRRTVRTLREDIEWGRSRLRLSVK